MTHPLILQLDVAGNPQAWISFEIACYYYAKDLVAWTPTQGNFTVFGGTSRYTCNRSFMDMSTIIAVKGEMGDKHIHRAPTLSNRGLFRRDCYSCAYCGYEYGTDKLTRDHIIPTSRNGKDVWLNVVAACSGCNRYKDNKTPEEAGMPLLFEPYIPTATEMLFLMNKHVLDEQAEFLKSRIPAHSRVHNPITHN
jgi:5-methylcytosine-specific restriction endonuclease McrA